MSTAPDNHGGDGNIRAYIKSNFRLEAELAGGEFTRKTAFPSLACSGWVSHGTVPKDVGKVLVQLRVDQKYLPDAGTCLSNRDAESGSHDVW